MMTVVHDGRRARDVRPAAFDGERVPSVDINDGDLCPWLLKHSQPDNVPFLEPVHIATLQ